MELHEKLFRQSPRRKKNQAERSLIIELHRNDDGSYGRNYSIAAPYHGASRHRAYSYMHDDLMS
ncbi:MAG: hypothetical protein AAFW81_00185 [Pseudomonadota bacterium]